MNVVLEAALEMSSVTGPFVVAPEVADSRYFPAGTALSAVKVGKAGGIA